jgi:hypothetical protein
MLLKVLLILFTIFFQIPFGQAQTLPAEGVYICVRWDLMRQIGEGFLNAFLNVKRNSHKN